MRPLCLLSLAAASSSSVVVAASGNELSSSPSSSWLAVAGKLPTKASGSSSSSNSSTKTITVGKGAFTFVPDSVTANKGDRIVFEFWSSGHSVARADFGYPCMPYEYNVPDGVGFWSGGLSDVSSGSHPTYSITVNDTSPIFFYCSAPGSCKSNNMVGVINPNDTQTLEEQKAAINPNILDLSPADPMPSETSDTDQPNPTTTPSGSTITPSETGHAHEPSGLSTGGIAGVVIGSAAVLLLAGSLVCICGRQGGFEKGYRRSKDAILPGGGGGSSSSSSAAAAGAKGSRGSAEPMFLPDGSYADDCCNNSVANTTSPMGQYALPARTAPNQIQDQNQNYFMRHNQSQSASTGGLLSPQSPASPPPSSSQRSTFQFQAYRPPGYVSSAASVSTQAPFHSEDIKYEAPDSQAPVELAADNENHVPKTY